MDTSAGKSPSAILSISGLSKRFKGLMALDNYHLDLFPGEIVGLIGPNGAGKTTVFNLITGIFTPSSGNIHFLGRDITKLRPDQIALQGIGRTFQNIRLFGHLTALQNLLVAVQIRKNYGFGGMLFNFPSFSGEEKKLFSWAESYLHLLDIGSYRNMAAKNLPYGVQRKLEIARALATKPHVLLLDEPAAGMNSQESLDLMKTIRRIRNDFKVAVVLIEHDMSVVMNLCERLQVLSYGKIIAQGIPDEIKNNATVIDAYLGRQAIHA